MTVTVHTAVIWNTKSPVRPRRSFLNLHSILADKSVTGNHRL